MPRELRRATRAVLDVLTDEPASTSDLYDRMGYPGLMRANLIPYPAFRNALAELEAEGLAQSITTQGEGTLWRRPA